MKYQSFIAKIIVALLMVAMFLMCFSCDIMKQSTKSKGESSVSEINESYRKRKGDTVSLVLPKITYKDTTIYTVNRQGTTLRTVYDERGQVSQIDCFASAIEEMTKQQNNFFESWKNKDKTKTEKFDSSFILYIIIGIVILCIVAMLLFYRTMNKNSEAIATILKKLN